MQEQIIDAKDERFWRDLEPLIFDQERFDRAADECATVLRVLGVAIPSRILDAGCGPGRHAHQLALMGHQVEGVDAIGYLIQKAQSRVALGENFPRFHVADLVHFAYNSTAEFDCALSLYHSIGYSDDPGDDSRILSCLHNLLRPGGKLFLELIDPDGFLPGQLLEFTTPVADEIFDERIQISPDRSRYQLTVRKRSAENIVYRARHRLFSRGTIADLLIAAGFSIRSPSADVLISYPGGSRKFCIVGEK